MINNSEVIFNASGSGWAIYRYVRFSHLETNIMIEYQSDGCGDFELWADNQRFSVLPFTETFSKYKTISAPITPVLGDHTLYLEWKITSGCAQIKRIQFSS